MRKLLLTAGAAAFSVLGAAASATTFNIDFVGAAAGNEQGVEGETLYFSELGYAGTVAGAGLLGVTATGNSTNVAYLDDVTGESGQTRWYGCVRGAELK